jgi:hypothetical protein
MSLLPTLLPALRAAAGAERARKRPTENFIVEILLQKKV